MPGRRPIALAILLGALAAPATAAAAPVIAPLKGCYVSAGPAVRQREPVQIVGSGFTPNSTVDVAVDGAVVVSRVQVDPQGGFSGSVPAPLAPAAIDRAFTVSATETLDKGATAAAQSRVTPLSVTATPRSAAPSQRVRFDGQGFTAPTPVFAHYLFHGRVKATVRMSPGTGLCGTWSAKRQQIPIANPKTGAWVVQFDQVKRFAEVPKGAYIRLPISVVAVPR